ncbi:hypothetical protein D047_1789 [Vibrio parahaemolyticus VPTS-2010_2]|nr:hypothetical protein D047_1789 [Vibrio parahaemolyticus VPTS-2010_2]
MCGCGTVIERDFVLFHCGSKLTDWRLVFNAATYGARLAADAFT